MNLPNLRLLLLALLITLVGAPHVQAQDQAPVTLTLEEALQIALVQNYTIRDAKLDLENADAQIREGIGQLFPQITTSSGYTRNLKSANPFAGSQAGGLFASLGFLDWLAFNERARTDEDPSTSPIALLDFYARQQQGLEEAGIVLSTSDNPFAIPNQFVTSVTLNQKVFDIRSFWGVSGAKKYLRAISQRQLDRQEQVLAEQVKQAFYQTLLADEQARVVSLSVERTRKTQQEVARQVAQGIAPKYQRLSAEVELANLETQYVQARSQAALALDNLKLLLGFDLQQAVQLRGQLDAETSGTYMTIAQQDAYAMAVERRPDLQQALLNVSLQQVQAKVARADYFPTLNANANYSYIGTVPDNRTFTLTDPSDPFKFTKQTNGFFSDAYWNQSLSVGLQLQWTLFNGRQTRARIQQQQIAVRKAQLQVDQLEQAIHLEVGRARRDLEASWQRIEAQRRNVERAELNYSYATTRLREGVANPLEERQASDLLDQSRLNYLQAVYDYLVARTAFETAVGMPLLASSPQLTSR